MRILLLGATTGYQTGMFVEAAARAGYEVAMATDQCRNLDDPWGDHAITVRFETPEWSVRQVVDATHDNPLGGILALGDRPVYLAARIAAELKLPFHPPRAAEACRNKFIAREMFRAAGLPVPEYRRLPLDCDPERAAGEAEYPCVLKPLGLSASRGVIRADDAGEFLAAFGRIKAILESRDIARLHEGQDRFLQVESYIPGREFAIEGLVSAGRLRVLALFDKPDPMEGPFFEETIYVTPSREPVEVQRSLVDATQRAVTALGLEHGPVHAEMRSNDRGVWMLEVAARPIGGLCAKAVRFRGGVTLEEVILRHAAGEEIGGLEPESGASGVMMIPIPKNGLYAGAAGIDEARRVAGIEDVIITAKPGQRLLKLPEGASYLGFVFARGTQAQQVERALRDAHSQMRFEISTVLEVR